mgnify:CR=1 FL=1
MKILDLSAGNRAVWFDKNYRDTTFVDIRPEVNPTVVADSRALPPEIGIDYALVVFDPPHVNFSAGAEMSKEYGHHTTQQIRDLILQTGAEAHRVTRPDALMALKWNDHDQKLAKILALLPHWEPLFGHKVAMRTLHASATTWVLLRRRDAPQAP